MRRDWRYVDADNGDIVGTMVCCSCHKLVTSGLFRYRDNGDSFVVQHRGCAAPNDNSWAKIDLQAERQRRHNVALLHEAKQFKAKWDISELDDLIAQLSDQLSSR